MLKEQLKAVRIPKKLCGCPMQGTYHNHDCECKKLAKAGVRVEYEPIQSYPNGCPILE